jgi:hypothetical protein
MKLCPGYRAASLDLSLVIRAAIIGREHSALLEKLIFRRAAGGISGIIPL